MIKSNMLKVSGVNIRATDTHCQQVISAMHGVHRGGTEKQT
jgi:hypothetical protein